MWDVLRKEIEVALPSTTAVIETSITWIVAWVWNLSMASSLFSPECWPSIRVYDMPACRKSASTRSRVYVQYATLGKSQRLELSTK